MDEFLQMHIFFLVTTIAVIVGIAFAALIWWRIDRILKNVDHISEQAAIESDLIRQDISELRSDLKHKKGVFVSFAKLFKGLLAEPKKKYSYGKNQNKKERHSPKG